MGQKIDRSLKKKLLKIKLDSGERWVNIIGNTLKDARKETVYLKPSLKNLELSSFSLPRKMHLPLLLLFHQYL